MFHWICPECGREIPPSVRECQACDPSAATPSVVEPAIPKPEVIPFTIAAEPPLLLEAAPVSDDKVVEEPVIESQPEPVAEVGPVVADVVASEKVVEEPGVETVRTEPIAETIPVVAEPVAVEAVVEEPVLETSLPEPLAEAAPVVAEAVAAQKVEPLIAEPAPVVSEVVASEEPVLKSEPTIAASPQPEEADIKLQDVPDPLLALAEEIRAAQAARAAALDAPPNSSGLLELAGAVGVPEALPAPQSARASEPVDAGEVTQKFRVSEMFPGPSELATAVALLAPPEPQLAPDIVQEPLAFHELRPAAEPEPEGPFLPFAPMQAYTPATSTSIKPVPPRAQILAPDAGPQITLPGPKLPPELTKLEDANVFTVMGEATAERTKEAIPPSKPSGGPSWFVSLLVMLLLLGAGLGTVFYLLPHTAADAKPAPEPAPTGGNSPLAKFIEVTGFRIVTTADATRKSEVQYLVVNHSDAQVSGANAFITLRSKPGQAPLCRFSFKVPALGPFESKEMSSPIERTARAVSLPDWQELRAEVQISK
jgi:hypothetical protein